MSLAVVIAILVCIVCSIYLYNDYNKEKLNIDIKHPNKKQISYLAGVFCLSIILFYCSGVIFKTNDGAQTYLLALLVSHFIVKECGTLK